MNSTTPSRSTSSATTHETIKTIQLLRICGAKNARRLPESLADIAALTIDEMIRRGISISDARKIPAAIQLVGEIAEPHGKYRAVRITSAATAMQYCQA